MNAYLIAGLRSAVTKAPKGGFRFTRPDDLAAEVIRQVLATLPQLDPHRIDELIVGNAVPEAEQGMQMGRIVSLLALPKEVPGMVVNRYCGSGLESIAIAAQRIHSGMADLILAGGTESMSMVPVMGWKTALNYTIASTHGDYYTSMGLTAEMVAREYQISRDDQDAFALASHTKAMAALDNGSFKAQIAPVVVEEVYVDERMKKQKRSHTIDTDEGPRRDTSLEALGKLKPVFAQGGTVTAGNSSQTSDGAAFVLVASEKMVREAVRDMVMKEMVQEIKQARERLNVPALTDMQVHDITRTTGGGHKFEGGLKKLQRDVPNAVSSKKHSGIAVSESRFGAKITFTQDTGNDIFWKNIPGTSFFVRVKVAQEDGPIITFIDGQLKTVDAKKGDVFVDKNTIHFHNGVDYSPLCVHDNPFTAKSNSLRHNAMARYQGGPKGYEGIRKMYDKFNIQASSDFGDKHKVAIKIGAKVANQVTVTP
ncbi:MAG: acetyl-CoA C-acyltransferase, partial [Sphingobacteriia bacterium]|nr:acetyl-CoA C-acyltransferase [Sphingobacteriia bacterium]